jgi:hypothetical protein
MKSREMLQRLKQDEPISSKEESAAKTKKSTREFEKQFGPRKRTVFGIKIEVRTQSEKQEASIRRNVELSSKILEPSR